MEYNANTPKRELTIKGVILSVIAPFAEGHVLTAGEAQVLNQTLAENLRNNFAGVVTEAVTKVGDASKVDVGTLQSELDTYTSEYEFGVRKAGAPAVSSLMRQALSLAKEALKSKYKKDGKDIKTLTAEQVAEICKGAVEKYPHFLEKAQAIIDAKKEAAGEELDLAA